MDNHILIGDTAPRIQYQADGSLAVFTYPFPIFAATDLEVWQDGIVHDGGFIVSGAGNSTGGTITFDTPPADGSIITLRRRMVIQRLSDFQTDGLIRAKTLNDELDYQTAIIQQIAEDTERAVRRSPASSSSANLTLPEPVAGRVLKWSGDGLALVNSSADPDNTAIPVTDLLAARDQALAARDQALAAVASIAAPLLQSENLGDLDDPAQARTNLEVYSTTEVDAAIAANGLSQAVLDRMAFLETNLAVNTLRDQIDTGWSVLKMVDGVADEFEDETGIASNIGATYDATGDFYGNAAAGADLITGSQSYSASHAGSPGNAADGNSGTYYRTNVNVPQEWWRVGFGSATATDSMRYLLASGSDANKISLVEWQGSNNGSTWTTLASTTSQTVGSWISMTYASVSYADYRLVFSLGAGGDIWITEVETWNSSAPAVTLVSVAHTAQSSPDEARLILLHQPISATTLGTDCTIEASRDGGTSWTAATPVLEGAFDATTNIVSASIDLSGQPTGTAMKWRFKTFNGKSQRLHGVWMQWR